MASFPGIKRLALISFSMFTIAQCGDPQSKQDQKDILSSPISIAVAANMQFAMDELIQAFTDETGIKCEITISSSGKLTAQIKQGAPFHVFVSANMKYPNVIYESTLADSVPKVYAHGKLVLWSMKEGIVPNLEILDEDFIRHIALANPETAPYGEAAHEALVNTHLYNKVKSKLVFGESIAQTNQFVMTESAEVGFTAMSVVLSPQLKDKGHWIEIDQNLYRPIQQGVVLIKQSHTVSPGARRFYDFLSSKKAKSILEVFGYDTQI